MERTTLILLSLGLCASLRATDTAQSNVRPLWFDECGRCHGDDGKANTPVGRKLQIKDYSSKKAQAAFTDEQALAIVQAGRVRDGKQVMPAYKDKMSVEQMKELIAFLRGMAKAP